jgi:hypothetical protein
MDNEEEDEDEEYFSEKYLKEAENFRIQEKSLFIIDENGLRQGLFINYHASTGNVWRKGNYKDGEYDGLIVDYEEDGITIEKIRLFEEGEEKSKEEMKNYLIKQRYGK